MCPRRRLQTSRKTEKLVHGPTSPPARAARRAGRRGLTPARAGPPPPHARRGADGAAGYRAHVGQTRKGTLVSGAQRSDPRPGESRALLEELVRESRHYSGTTILVELATLGPVTYALVGGRRGVARHRACVERDEQRFIPLYRRTLQTLQTLLAPTPAGPRPMRLVDRAIEHDHRENANLLAAFDLLDPPAPAAR